MKLYEAQNIITDVFDKTIENRFNMMNILLLKPSCSFLKKCSANYNESNLLTCADTNSK